MNKAIIAYLDGEEPAEYSKQGTPLKYTKKFFDDEDKKLDLEVDED